MNLDISRLYNFPFVLSDFEDAISTDGTISFMLFLDRDGNISPKRVRDGFAYEVKCSRIVNDGKTEGYSLEVIEHTKQIRENIEHEAHKNRMQLLARSVSGGLVYISPDFRVKWRYLDNIFDAEISGRVYVEGRKCYECLGQTEPCMGCPVLEVMQSTSTRSQIFHKDISDRYYEIFATPAREGNVLKGYLLELRDVTKRERASRQLTEALDKAARGERMKSLFIKNLTHEIRTPLNSIMGFTQVLCGESGACISEEERSGFAHLIETNANLLSKIIEDTILLSSLESVNFHMRSEMVCVSDILDNICGSVINKREDVVFKLDVDKDVSGIRVKTDPELIGHILNNYLSNAYKYTESGSITLSIRRKEEDSRWLTFSVTDTGCGLKGCGDDIFDKFGKADDFKQGAGLGLAICREVARLTKGRVYVDSSYVDGARFCYDFPLRKADRLYKVDDVR